MIIVNQERNKTFEFKEVEIVNNTIAVVKNNEHITIGLYESEEEAKKVFLDVVSDADRKRAVCYMPL